MPIAYQELQGYPRCSVSGGRFQGVRKFRVAWSDWPEFYGQLFGTFQYIGGAATITLPASYPGVQYTYVDSVDVEGIGKITSGVLGNLSASANEYAYADLTCTYMHLPPPSGITIPSGTILTYGTNLGVEYQTVPGRTWEWLSDNEPLPSDVNPGIIIPTEDMHLSFMRVPTIPSAARSLRGKINTSAFLGYSAYTVLYMGASISREFQIVIPPNTPSLYRIDYHFLVKDLDRPDFIGWNSFYRPDGPNYDEVQEAGSGAPVYDDGDFSTLFQLT